MLCGGWSPPGPNSARPASLREKPATSVALLIPLQPHAWPLAAIRQEANAGPLESGEDKRLGGPLQLVALTFEVADRAARDSGSGCELILRPVQQSARGATQFRT